MQPQQPMKADTGITNTELLRNPTKVLLLMVKNINYTMHASKRAHILLWLCQQRMLPPWFKATGNPYL